MNEYEAVKIMADAAGTNYRQLSLSLGKADNYINNAIRGGRVRGSRMQLDTLTAIARQCGYKLVLVPEGETPPDGLALD